MVDININVPAVEKLVPAVEKLLDYVASGIGTTAGPLFVTWRASQEGKARVIAARANAEVQQIQAAQEGGTPQLIKKAQAEAREYVATSDGLEPGGDIRVQEAMEFQARKRFMNVGTIAAGHASEELGDTEVPDHDPDPDWTARFFDGAQDVSSEYLQRLWGKILAGEIKSPGQTSLHTLSILRNMTQQEAKDFSDLMRFRISRSIFIEGISRVDKRFDHLIVHFSHIGLLGGFGAYENVTLGDNGKRVVKHCSHALIIEGPSNFNLGPTIMDHTRLITFAGLEIAKLCQHQEPDMTYLSHFARFLTEKNCKLKLAPAIDLDDQSAFIGVEKVIEPFTEPKDRDQEEPGNAE